MRSAGICVVVVGLALSVAVPGRAAKPDPLTLSWENDILRIRGEHLPGKEIPVRYIEAYCRPGSTDADWVKHTVVGHTTEVLSLSADGTRLVLRCTLKDGVVVTHTVTTTHDEVDFRLVAHNPTGRRSEAHWAQPCMRVANFTGADQAGYLAKSFVFLDGEPTRMPTPHWATQARYVPGQVWCPKHVDRNDVNPRPLSSLVPSNGLIGCYSADESMILATAFEPYQELFQGVIVCLHADFRLGGLQPGETKSIRGKIYAVPADLPALLSRYARDFPEHQDAE